ncbi:phospholipase A2 inhibitor beta isoform X2 [Athalia rosae]|uniref:phospholipase A2 inhibitor beta isoform X2 n=1 Tax=Athalia rosae TaxID=37344 RepID=UPI0006267881|nr:phospholipase A2 inhibitor beta isoform X2 [Athalia rosae]XP_048504767.1 phospholipase A2 inhibitor beta isoform X2 [Athalia rosae]
MTYGKYIGMTLLVGLLFFVVSLCAAQSPNFKCDDPNFHSLETDYTKRTACHPSFQNKCFCHMACYEGLYQHIVNCTDAGFTDTKPLEHLPNNTRVLIFVGNDLPELSWNIFGTLDALPELRVIDMSRNKIREIRGKAYHHVKNVEQLFLDFNELSLDPARSHPRVFSNFISLLELHLTDAFEDGSPRDLAETLHDIFVNSNLTQLTKLHLEQNEISEFHDANVFCDLPNLLHLYIGSNSLNALHFNLTCMRKLRFLDLERNKFTRVLEHDLRVLDSIVRDNIPMMVDFTSNPFECGCKLNPFIHWMNKTKITVRNPHLLQCTKGKEVHKLREEKHCGNKLGASSYHGSTVVLWLLSILLVVLIVALIYIQRVELGKKIEPVIDSVSKRVRYKSIATGETREMDV